MPRVRAGTKNEIFTVKDFDCEDGSVLDLSIAYRVFGNASDPTILHPTCFGGVIDGTLGLLAPGKVLSEDYHVIVCALLGNGESSSPSNTPSPFDGPRFPKVVYRDNIRLQHRLCRHLGIEKLKAVIGFSMGCQQVYHWATLYPDFLEWGIGLAGSASTSLHNICFLEGPKNALLNSIDFQQGDYDSKPIHGLKAFGRAYSAWALSAPWFREETFKTLGHDTLEAYLQAEWDDGFGWDANDLLCLLHTWQTGSIHYPTFSSYAQSLAAIKAKMLIMPSRTDQYFPPEDSIFEVQQIGDNAELVVIESIWGHIAGSCNVEPDATFISNVIRKHLDPTKAAEGLEKDGNTPAEKM